MSNFLNVIIPYKWEGCWVFDDAKYDLVKEPFVSGADSILDQLANGIEGAESGFKLLFSDSVFPGYQTRYQWIREEHGGNWYLDNSTSQEGWLCPALLNYLRVSGNSQ